MSAITGAKRMNKKLERPSQSLAGADNLETLIRPVLGMLEVLTGLESTYLTSIDVNREVQTVLYSRNSGKIDVPEGMQIPWLDPLYQRCLEGGLRVVTNVREIWDDSQTAARFGIQTFASAPVYAGSGAVAGTLCGISRSTREPGSRARHALTISAKLISDCLQREQSLEQLRLMNGHLVRQAHVDDVTGLPNRKALNEELGKMLAHASHGGSYVLVCMLDLGDLKEVNDHVGLSVGDQFVRSCANRLTQALNGKAFVARINWDQFALVAPGPEDFDEAMRLATAIARRSCLATFGDYAFRNAKARYEGAHASCVAVRFLTVQQALEIADQELLRARRERVASRGSRSLWKHD
jgi:diguanylate cyclase